MKRKDGCLTAIIITVIIAIIVAVYYYQLSGSLFVSIFIVSPVIVLIIGLLPMFIAKRKLIKLQEQEMKNQERIERELKQQRNIEAQQKEQLRKKNVEEVERYIQHLKELQEIERSKQEEKEISIVIKDDIQQTIENNLQSIDLMSGIEFESYCASLLESIGYKNVKLTKSSGDQGADIICERYGEKIAVQCKCYSSPIGNKPVQEVLAGKMYYDCNSAMVMTNSYFTQSAREIARKAKVRLCDRDNLADLLRELYYNRTNDNLEGD